MKKTNKKISMVCMSLSTLVLLSGCAPKQDDNLAVKTLKHASMTPVYAGAVIEGALMVAVAVPLVLLTGGFKHKIEIEENKYKGKIPSKAFAIAVDSNKKYAYGYSWKGSSQEFANTTALELCNKNKLEKNVIDECVLYYIGDEQQFDLSTKLEIKSSDNNESTNNQNEAEKKSESL
ncbi:MAG: hypothetical protein PHS65_02965 [Arcobacteraceae bacterium]|nr:hypothetical protein [Arcobacteraceae bacterium]